MSEFDCAEHAVIEVIEGTSEFLCGLREVVTYQEKWNENLRRYWQDRGFTASELQNSAEIPGVPTEVFRHVPLVSSELKVKEVYRTSGTSSGRRGEHHRFRTRAYDLGARKHFAQCIDCSDFDGAGIHFLTGPASTPDSSLVHMVEDLSRWLGCEPLVYLLDSAEDPWRSLDERSSGSDPHPAFIFGTAFAFAEWFLDGKQCELPGGSVVIETGGFKSSALSMDHREYVERLKSAFGSSASYFSEYSMTELSSQGYGPLDGDRPTRFRFPEWCQVNACDPDTLEPLGHGELGILRFVDLCNVETCVAIQTEDLGVVHPEGVELLGRLPDATPRGCSLAAEELFAGLR